jgi:hypothetical protein
LSEKGSCSAGGRMDRFRLGGSRFISLVEDSSSNVMKAAHGQYDLDRFPPVTAGPRRATDRAGSADEHNSGRPSCL